MTPNRTRRSHGASEMAREGAETGRRTVTLKLSKVIYEKRGHLAYVTINNPEHQNCISEEVDHDLWKVWHDVRGDPQIYVAILTGAGAKSFCSGSDLRGYVAKMVAKQSPELNRRRALEGPNLGGITKGINVWKPIIAAINGHCLAAGMELAMACDIRIAADHAVFAVANRRWNVGAESGLTQRLPHIVGLGVALDLLITGRWFDAQEAYRIHFVSRVVEGPKLMEECTKLAEEIAQFPQSSLRTDKEACIRGLGLTLEEGLRLENTLWNTNLSLPDTLEGPRAFVEKRKFVPTQET
jgi:enoyl-CoA hydratase